MLIQNGHMFLLFLYDKHFQDSPAHQAGKLHIVFAELGVA